MITNIPFSFDRQLGVGWGGGTARDMNFEFRTVRFPCVDPAGRARRARGGAGPAGRRRGLSLSRPERRGPRRRRGGCGRPGGRPGLVSPLATSGRRGRGGSAGGRVREAGSFVSLAREAGNRLEAPGGRRGRRGTSAGSAGRWRPLRGRRAEGGPGRRPGGGARAGPARAGFICGRTACSPALVLQGAGRRSAGPAMDRRWGFLIGLLSAAWLLLRSGHDEQRPPETAAQRCFCQVSGARGRADLPGAPQPRPALHPARPGGGGAGVHLCICTRRE